MPAAPAFVLLSAVSLGAALAVLSAAPPAVDLDPSLARDLHAAARRTVFFGHQSVGANVLAGLTDLSARAGGALRVVERASAAGLAPGTWAHAALGVNGDPRSKLRAFARALDSATEDPDVALVKLCYVDFDGAEDPAAVFAEYRATLEALRARHPGTTFVHVTVPLTSAARGPKALVKRLLGREPSEARNARRERYNALLRGAYAGREPVFDLARVESTRPDGRVETVAWRGDDVPALFAGYTDDGGHLNAEGRARAARALLAVVAALPERARGPAATEAQGWTR